MRLPEEQDAQYRWCNCGVRGERQLRHCEGAQEPARITPTSYLRVANVQRGYLDLRVIKQIEVADEEIIATHCARAIS